MKTTELRDVIARVLPEWEVTVNEQKMLNVMADDIERCQGFAYVEEFAQSVISYEKFGKTETYTHNVYFCVLGEFDTTAEQREYIRQERIAGAVADVVRELHNTYGVEKFRQDFFPRGFDANEVTIHLQFSITSRRC